MRLLAGALLVAVCGAAMAQFEDPCKSKSKRRTSAHETQCDAYYECFNGDPVLQYCPNGLVYNGLKKQGLLGVCDYDHKVDCFDRPERNPPLSTTYHCDWLYGIFGHENSSTRYWTCWNGTATEGFCSDELIYNEQTHACDWPSNVEVFHGSPVCTEDPDGNLPLGTSCERYWACKGGYPSLQRCPATLVFDKQSLRCVSPPTIDCEVPTTTETPFDENNEAHFRVGDRGGQGQSGGQGGRPAVHRLSRPRPQSQQRERRPHPALRSQQESQQPITISPQSTQDLPFVPARAIPVQFNEPQPQSFDGNFRPQGQQQQNFRPPPIASAIPLN